MTWPWVSRRQHEAAEARAKWAEGELRRVSETLAAREQECIMLDRSNTELRADNRKLIDRIVQMSGQPPIFNPVPADPAPAPAPKEPAAVSTIPAPETRTSFNDVHRAARKAIASGDFNRPAPITG